MARKVLFDSEVSYAYPVSDTQYRSEETGLISLVVTDDPLTGEVVQAGMVTLKPTSGLRVYGSLFFAALWVLLVASSVLFFLVWIVRLKRGQIPPGAAIRMRVWPFLASVSIALVVGLFLAGMNDPFRLFGGPNLVSLGIMVLTVAFVVFALAGIYTSVREKDASMTRVAWWHYTITSFAHSVVALYLLWFGFIGVRIWA